MALKYNGPVSETRAGVVEDKFSYTAVVRVGDFPGITPSELSQAVFETIKQYQSEQPESDVKPSKAEAKRAAMQAKAEAKRAKAAKRAANLSRRPLSLLRPCSLPPLHLRLFVFLCFSLFFFSTKLFY